MMECNQVRVVRRGWSEGWEWEEKPHPLLLPDSAEH